MKVNSEKVKAALKKAGIRVSNPDYQPKGKSDVLWIRNGGEQIGSTHQVQEGNRKFVEFQFRVPSA